MAPSSSATVTKKNEPNTDVLKSFVENPWAGRAAGYLGGIQTISGAKWKKTFDMVSKIVNLPEPTDTIDLTAIEDSDPRSQVLLSDDSDAAD